MVFDCDSDFSLRFLLEDVSLPAENRPSLSLSSSLTIFLLLTFFCGVEGALTLTGLAHSSSSRRFLSFSRRNSSTRCLFSSDKPLILMAEAACEEEEGTDDDRGGATTRLTVLI